jgi:hypothetical protein
MSSRALRRLQKQRDQEKELAETVPSEDEDQLDLASPPAIPHQNKTNAFDLLAAGEEDQASSSDNLPQPSEDEDVERTATVRQPKRKKKKKKKGKATLDAGPGGEDQDASGVTTPALAEPDGDTKGQSSQVLPQDDEERPEDVPSASRKKKKNKGKRKQETKAPSNDQDSSFLDTIPRNPIIQDGDNDYPPAWKEVNLLLAVDSKDLNPMNEMKRLFGNIVLEAERENRATPETGRRRGRAQQVDLGGALDGRHFAATQGRLQPRTVAGATLRRNIFMPGKEEWPKATSGGLGMEFVEETLGGLTYEFVHNASYQDTQRQFYMVVESMDPQRMISLLQHNPYHVATLLQVSEIAKQQGDHSVSADLLERALFTFGRSVHSTFGANLREGMARFDFVVQENREFWLTVWRYLLNLGQRGTWRTAYEWAKLLLSLDQTTDPYGMTLMIDQLALRARHHDHFIKLCQNAIFRRDYFNMRPNLQISLALAYFRAGKGDECQQQLETCIQRFPWMFARLFKELSIDHIPKSIWGAQAETEYDRLMCELYVTRAKDLWNSPETISLLKKTAGADLSRNNPDSSTTRSVIDESEARHIVLLEDPALLVLLPPSFRNRYGSPGDPLPPANPFSRSDDTTSEEEDRPAFMPELPRATVVEGDDGPFITLEGGDTSWLNRLLDFVRLRGDPADTNADGEPEGRYIEQMIRMVQQEPQGAQDPDAATADDHQPSVEESFWESDPEESFRAPMFEDDDGPVLETLEEADQRTQRFLAGRGLQALKEFIAVNGVDEGNWPWGLDQAPLTEYAQKVISLRSRATRQFILNYNLPQGTSAMVKDLVVRRAETLQPGSTR